MTFKRVIGFGDALHLEALAAPGGLNKAVDKIREAVGPQVGTRNTFAKLFHGPDVPTDPTERQRAWLLLLALDQDPRDWGLADFDPPPAWDLGALRDSLSRDAWSSLLV